MSSFFVVFAMAICGWGGAYVAKARGKKPALWAIICALSPLAGVLLLAASSRPSAKRPQLSVPEAGMSTTGSFSQAELKRWKTLVELDPDIAAAAAIARKKGIGCEMILAEKYLTLNDKSYLQPALEEALAENAKKADANLGALAVPTDAGNMAGTIAGQLGTSLFRKSFGGDYSIANGPLSITTFSPFGRMISHFKAGCAYGGGSKNDQILYRLQTSSRIDREALWSK